MKNKKLNKLLSLNKSANKRGEDPVKDERKNILSADSDFYVREAYKTLRTNVSFALTDAEECKVIGVTSSLQSEGKSITALNLAISYAMTDRKVLIIDCDLRRPKLNRLMQVSAKSGLSNLIMNSQLMDEAIRPTHISGLDVILSGDIPPNPSELLGSPKMQKLLLELRKSYDYIILDSPPVNMVTDAVVLSPQCDGMLFLVRAGRSERGAVIHAVEQLEYAKAKILGFILNDINMEKSHYGYGKYRYKRYFRYGKYGYYKTYYSRSNSGYGYGYGYSAPTAKIVEQPEESMRADEQ